MSTLTALKELFNRDLNKLKTEVSLYQHEPALWMIEANIANTAGNLCLHLVGNLNTFIGTHLGNSGYVRHRELEFSLKDVPRAELLQKIDDTINVVEKTLNNLSEEKLAEEYPVAVFDGKTTTAFMLIHLATHLGYHLGQINYHRRLLDK
ncbi:DinB family protein [Chitinophaga filiformis]|uniref:DinB family protein n=1 Tax=Chitinophaga filiformis TaxID=104663 RepID=UPI001F2A34F4|nr:DinB family protein [Chitinophaga filiformis]MCF6406917.1 DinB family protein [Chitinophaga filiformis]